MAFAGFILSEFYHLMKIASHLLWYESAVVMGTQEAGFWISRVSGNSIKSFLSEIKQIHKDKLKY